MKFKDLKASVLVFKNGKLVCSGARGVDAAYKALNRTLRILRKAGIKPGKLKTKVENIVVSGGLGLDYSLARLAETLPRSIYEPEYFPGLIYRMEDPKTVVLIFPKGKAVFTGLKNEDDACIAAEKLRKIILNHINSYPSPITGKLPAYTT